MNPVSQSLINFSTLLTVLAFFILKDMNFHPRYDKQMTPQKSKGSDVSPTVKRIRLISPSPVKKTSTKSDDQSILSNTLNYPSDIIDDTVSIILIILFN